MRDLRLARRLSQEGLAEELGEAEHDVSLGSDLGFGEAGARAVAQALRGAEDADRVRSE